MESSSGGRKKMRHGEQDGVRKEKIHGEQKWRKKGKDTWRARVQ